MCEIAGGDYNAIHVRMGDYSKRSKGLDVGSIWTRKMQSAHFDKTSHNLYFATEPSTNKHRFSKVIKAYHTYFSADLDEDLIAEFDKLFDKGHVHLRNDILGNVEQLICALAKKFQGTSFSTFSQFIFTLRQKRPRAILFPEAA